MPRQDAGIHRCAVSRSREAVRALSLAAVVTALHLAVLARRVPARCLHLGPAAPCIWQAPADVHAAPCAADQRTSSRPTQSFAAGTLCLAVGMALITFAAWLHIMRINGAHGP